MPPYSAEIKFWNNPYLMEILIPFLDSRSIVSLAKAHPLVLQVLQGKSVWNKLVRRVCPFSFGYVMENEIVADTEERLAGVMAQMNHLVQILKMMDDPADRLLDLLDVICERFPPVDTGEREALRAQLEGTGFSMINRIPGPQFFQIHCSRHGSHMDPTWLPHGPHKHKVSPFGFLILEEIEKELGTTEQMLDWAVVDIMSDPWLSALSSRLVRQNDFWEGVRVDMLNVECYSTSCAEALSTVMEHCEMFEIQNKLCIEEDIGAEGWAALRRGLACHEVSFLLCDKEHMASGQRSDLRAIWESLSDGWEWERGPRFSKQTEGHNWQLLEQYLDMAEEDWSRLFPHPWEEDSSSSGEEDSDGEGSSSSGEED